MAGLYIHIPLCSSRCHYCDFFSSTAFSKRRGLVDSICTEMSLRRNYWGGEDVSTIYLGGGTPSLLTRDELNRIFDSIFSNFSCDLSEVTIEANPDDVTPVFVETLRSLPVNRVSMGVQSFHDDDLRLINRRHDSSQAVAAVRLLQDSGFDNLSVDLIYALPGQTADKWQYNIDKALSLDVPHISAYHLTYEEGTVLHRMLVDGRISQVSEDDSLLFFSMLRSSLLSAGYEHYEISNFSKPGMRAKHNSSYWNFTPYIGLGPSAHSFDGVSRQWNVSDIDAYVEGVRKCDMSFDYEDLSIEESYNDLVITSLRTSDGLSLSVLKSRFPSLYDYCLENAKSALSRGLLRLDADCLRLTEKGIFLSDSVFVDLMKVD